MKDNKLIAEFMGLREGDKYLSPCLEDPECIGLGMYVALDEMRYHASWDWLMPVVNQCLKTGDNTGKWDDVYSAVCTIDIEEVYKAVVEFIEEEKE